MDNVNDSVAADVAVDGIVDQNKHNNDENVHYINDRIYARVNKSIQRCKQSNENDNNNNNNGKLSDYLQCIEPYHKIKNHKLINGKIMNPMIIYNGMIQSSSDDNSGTGIKCITGSMEHRMRTLPILALYHARSQML
ncbi:hypothetical protein BLOT_010249 [Blomia tropicalis]|nr:hypothetical protein BLOT_010249 [Blomia tropicalis]